MTKPWLLYGAYGYSGALIAEEAVRRGHKPILCGRSEARLRPLADRLGLDYRVASLDDPAALAAAVSGVALVLHAAGPFSRTSEPMIRACLAAGAHYLDITGEIEVFNNTFRHDAAARAKGIVLISGVGFDVVPSDCLARYVADKLPGATRLDLAIGALGTASAGTMKSSLEGLARGGLVATDRGLQPLALGRGARQVRFSDKTRWVMPIPWGDLATAPRSTGIANVTTYMTFPPKVIKTLARLWPLVAAARPLFAALWQQTALREKAEARIAASVKGPDEAMRETTRSYLWARVQDARGQTAEAWLETVEGYKLTAEASVLSVERVLAGSLAGALTPSQAFGADFVLAIPGTKRYDSLP